ncbi:MAG: FadR family transcriptional regulator [Oscillospiraceae bacterium]|nr:FadR family transcriptional regulator [Oscillospiraceae bacterium]
MEKKNLSRQVADDLYRMIAVTQELKPGQQLPGEMILSDQLGVSRSTLREAIKSLVSQGVLKVYRGKGTFVSESMENFVSFGLDELDMNRSRVKDLFEARLLFEPQMAALACERATDEEIENILQAGAEVERQILSNQDRTPADQEFHKKIAIASHNRFMLQLLPIVHSAVSETIQLNEQQELLSENTLRDHAQIMYFIQKRDADGAKAAMTIHLRSAMTVLGL